MALNIVLNNSSRAFSEFPDTDRAEFDQPRVVATPGTDAQVDASLISQLEDGSLAAMGRGLVANFQA